MIDQHKPCPFCGSTKTYSEGPAYGRSYWYVFCDDCQAEGPPAKRGVDEREDHAIALWNTRAPMIAAKP